MMRMFRDGIPVAESQNGALSLEADPPGVYRVEARIAERQFGRVSYQPWIQSNAISILSETRIRERLAASRLGPPRSTFLEVVADERLAPGIQSEGNEGCRSKSNRAPCLEAPFEFASSLESRFLMSRQT